MNLTTLININKIRPKTQFHISLWTTTIIFWTAIKTRTQKYSPITTVRQASYKTTIKTFYKTVFWTIRNFYYEVKQMVVIILFKTNKKKRWVRFSSPQMDKLIWDQVGTKVFWKRRKIYKIRKTTFWDPIFTLIIWIKKGIDKNRFLTLFKTMTMKWNLSRKKMTEVKATFKKLGMRYIRSSGKKRKGAGALMKMVFVKVA